MTEPQPSPISPSAPEIECLPNGRRGYEIKDASPRVIAAFGAGMIVAALIIVLLLWGFVSYLSNTATRPPARPLPPPDFRTQLPPDPRLEINELTDLQPIRAAEDENLLRYGWADKAHGRARIPIDVALKIVAERGLPDWSSKPRDVRGGGNQDGGQDRGLNNNAR